MSKVITLDLENISKSSATLHSAVHVKRAVTSVFAKNIFEHSRVTDHFIST